MSGKRIEYIDLTKGIGIIYVILLHISPVCFFAYIAILSCFFLVSGMMINETLSFGVLMKKSINNLFVPFVFFYVASYLVFYALRYSCPELVKTSATGILDIFTQRQWFNGPLWFIICLFWGQMLLLLIIKFVRFRWLRPILVSVIGLTGYYLGNNSVILPAVTDVSMSILPLIYCGWLLKKTESVFFWRHDNFNWKCLVLFAVCTLSYFTLYSYCHPRFHFHYNMPYGYNPILLIVYMVCGAMMLILSCKGVSAVCNFISDKTNRFKWNFPLIRYFGKYSLIPLCLHHMIYRPVTVSLKLLSVDNWNIAGFSIPSQYLVSIITILLCFALIPVFKKFFPHISAQKSIF